MRKELFEPIGKNFGDNLVGDITEGNWPEAVKRTRVNVIRDESKV